MDMTTLLLVLDSTLRLATPLVFASLAGLFSERSGVIDIGLEGKILISAFFSASVAAFTGNVWLGLMGGILASVSFALIHGVASITFRGNQLISGVAINFLASGVTVIIGEAWFKLGGRTPQLEGPARFQEITLPFAETLRPVPFIGPIYAEVISGHSILVYVAVITVALSWWVLFRSRFGLRLRAVGENPESVDTAGISVARLRYTAVVIAGVLCGMSGSFLATGLAAGFVKEMSAGRGFIALAALIFAKWRPWYVLWACLLFGLLEALGNRFQNIDVSMYSIAIVLVPAIVFGSILARQRSALSIAIAVVSAALTYGVIVLLKQPLLSTGSVKVPTQFMQALPYILTVVILAGFVGKAIPPRAGGEPYVKER